MSKLPLPPIIKNQDPHRKVMPITNHIKEQNSPEIVKFRKKAKSKNSVSSNNLSSPPSSRTSLDPLTDLYPTDMIVLGLRKLGLFERLIHGERFTVKGSNDDKQFVQNLTEKLSEKEREGMEIFLANWIIHTNRANYSMYNNNNNARNNRGPVIMKENTHSTFSEVPKSNLSGVEFQQRIQGQSYHQINQDRTEDRHVKR